MGEKQTYVFEFGEYRLDPAECRLLRDGEIIPLTPKALELLCALVENGGRLMEKNRLMEMLWADAFVEEGNLADNVSKIRQALGDSRKQPKFIETISGRGYRFIADVEAIETSAAQNLGAESDKTPANAVASQTGADGESLAAPADPTINEKGLPGTRVERTSPFFLATVGNYFSPHATRLERRASHPPAKFDSSGNHQSTRILPLVQTSIWKQRSRSFALAAVFIGLAGVLIFSWYATLPPLSARTGKSIAVLPFKPLVASDRDEALELGMSDSLISGLSRLRQITVRPISAVRRYTDLEQDARAAGRELGVESVLDGNIQRTGERIRISARLVRVEDGQTLWTETFDEKFTDIFAVQDSISQRIIGALALQLSGDERNDLIKKYTDNAEAYQLYLKGRFFWSKLTPDGLQKSLDFYSQAIETDPDYALAYAGLADSYNLLGSYGFWPLKESHPKARAAAEKALAIDAELAEAHASLAAIIADYYWDWALADRHFKRAIDLNPNYPVARKWYSQHLARLGRLDEGVEEAKRAQMLDPLSSSANAHVGVALYRARRFDEAILELQKGLEFDPKAIDAHIFLGFVYAQQGKSEETIDEFQTVVELSERSPSLVTLLGYAYASAGKRREAQSILEEIDLRSTDGQTFPLERALIYIGLGEHDLAFEWLERAFEERAWQLGFLKVEPLFDPLRGDRRFSGLLHRLNLTP